MGANTGNWSIWRKIGMVISVPFLLLILLPYAFFYEKVKSWNIRRKRGK